MARACDPGSAASTYEGWPQALLGPDSYTSYNPAAAGRIEAVNMGSADAPATKQAETLIFTSGKGTTPDLLVVCG